MLDNILRDEDLLVRVTKFTLEKLDYLLDKFNNWLMAHPWMAPLFSSDDTRSGERGNRCKLEPKYVLLIHYKSDPTQDSLEAQFAIDQSIYVSQVGQEGTRRHTAYRKKRLQENTKRQDRRRDDSDNAPWLSQIYL